MLREFFSGVGLFFRGLGSWGRSPRLMMLGAVPALIVGALVLTAVILVIVNLDALAHVVTPFAEGWDEPWRAVTRLAAAVGLLVALLLLAVSTFTALTLAIGDPFYEKIWLAVEAREGGFEQAEDLGFWASLRRSIAGGLRLLLPSIGVGILAFGLGFVPVVGGAVALVLGALLGGRLLSRELLTRPFDGRGIDAREQKRLVAGRRAYVTGFGAAAYLVFLLPLGAVFATPAAVAGSTLLARELLREERPTTGKIV